MRIQITGSRDFTDIRLMERALLDITANPTDDEPITIIHGGARGADSIAERLAIRHSWRSVIYRARWREHGVYNPMAGKIRNGQMLDLNPDVVLAFKKRTARNNGTQDAIDKARARSLRVLEYWED